MRRRTTSVVEVSVVEVSVVEVSVVEVSVVEASVGWITAACASCEHVLLTGRYLVSSCLFRTCG